MQARQSALEDSPSILFFSILINDEKKKIMQYNAILKETVMKKIKGESKKEEEEKEDKD